jgi:hypothetical protein
VARVSKLGTAPLLRVRFGAFLSFLCVCVYVPFFIYNLAHPRLSHSALSCGQLHKAGKK